MAKLFHYHFSLDQSVLESYHYYKKKLTSLICKFALMPIIYSLIIYLIVKSAFEFKTSQMCLFNYTVAMRNLIHDYLHTQWFFKCFKMKFPHLSECFIISIGEKGTQRQDLYLWSCTADLADITVMQLGWFCNLCFTYTILANRSGSRFLQCWPGTSSLGSLLLLIVASGSRVQSCIITWKNIVL